MNSLLLQKLLALDLLIRPCRNASNLTPRKKSARISMTQVLLLVRLRDQTVFLSQISTRFLATTSGHIVQKSKLTQHSHLQILTKTSSSTNKNSRISVSHSRATTSQMMMAQSQNLRKFSTNLTSMETMSSVKLNLQTYGSTSAARNVMQQILMAIHILSTASAMASTTKMSAKHMTIVKMEL